MTTPTPDFLHRSPRDQLISQIIDLRQQLGDCRETVETLTGQLATAAETLERVDKYFDEFAADKKLVDKLISKLEGKK